MYFSIFYIEIRIFELHILHT